MKYKHQIDCLIYQAIYEFTDANGILFSSEKPKITKLIRKQTRTLKISKGHTMDVIIRAYVVKFLNEYQASQIFPDIDKN